MSNWIGTARSNYFRVKDPAAFEAFVNEVADLECWKSTEGLYAVKPSRDSDTGGFPEEIFSEDDDDDVDFADALSEHLQEGEIAILMEAGAEKTRYITGTAIAVHSDGRQVNVSLDDIYALAATEFGVARESITVAEY